MLDNSGKRGSHRRVLLGDEVVDSIGIAIATVRFEAQGDRLEQRTAYGSHFSMTAPSLLFRQFGRRRIALVFGNAFGADYDFDENASGDQGDDHDDLPLLAIGIGRNSGKVSSIDSRLTIEYLHRLTGRVRLSEVIEALRADEASAASQDLRYGFHLSPLGPVALGGLRKLLGDDSSTLDELVEVLLSRGRQPSGDSSEDGRAAEQANDAALLALRVFGSTNADKRRWIDHASTRRRVSRSDPGFEFFLEERSVIRGDHRKFPGSQIFETIHPDAIRFTARGKELFVLYVDSTSVETATGADLIYVNHSDGSIVVVQYKMLDHVDDDLIHRFPRGELDQLGNLLDLESICRDPEPSESVRTESDYRLAPCVAYYKFVSRQRPADPHSTDLMAGHLVSAEQLSLYLAENPGPNDGKLVRFDWLSARSLDASTFARLVSQGQTGSRGVSTQVILELIRDYLPSLHLAIVAIES